MTDRERLLDELRPVAFAIACRMLSSVSEAENVAQEALLRVHQALDAGEQIASPRAFAATVTTGWAINELRSAGALRERNVGEWLPEPIITEKPRAAVARWATSSSGPVLSRPKGTLRFSASKVSATPASSTVPAQTQTAPRRPGHIPTRLPTPPGRGAGHGPSPRQDQILVKCSKHSQAVSISANAATSDRFTAR